MRFLLNSLLTAALAALSLNSKVAIAEVIPAHEINPVLESVFAALSHQRRLPGGCTSQSEKFTGRNSTEGYWFRFRNKMAENNVGISIEQPYRNLIVEIVAGLNPSYYRVRIRLPSTQRRDANDSLILDLERGSNRILYLIAVDRNGSLVCSE